MSNVTITIIGAGAIGTSMGLALKKNDNPPTLIVHDKDYGTGRLAVKQSKAFDKTEWNLINACEPADAIILAIPAAEIEATLEAIKPYLKEHVVISDTSPSKQLVIKQAQAILPETAYFVGGHPIVSTPGSGPDYARANLFEKALYCLTPTADVHPDAVQFMQDFAALLGATPFFLEPAEHDGLLSGVHNLPQLLSMLLINSVSGASAWPEMRRLAGQLFVNVSQGAKGDASDITNTLLADKDNILRWLDSSLEGLETWRDMITQNDSEKLNETIEKAIFTRQQWLDDFESQRLSDLQEREVVEYEKQSFLNQWLGFGRHKGKSK